MRRSSGFTLLEVLVATAVTAMILSIVYSSFGRTIESKEYVELGNEAYHRARWALDKIGSDLACAYVHRSNNSNSLFYAASHDISGMPMDELHFTSFAHVSMNPLIAESDQCEIGYKVAWISELERFQLWRREDPTVDANNMQGGDEYMLVDDLVAFNVRFWDGFSWADNWDSRPYDTLTGEDGASEETEFQQTDEMLKASPAAVEVSVAVNGPDGRPIIFTSKVKVEMSTISLKALDEEDDDDDDASSGGSSSDSKNSNKTSPFDSPTGGYVGAG